MQKPFLSNSWSSKEWKKTGLKIFLIPPKIMQIQRCFGILSEVGYTYILASQQMPPPFKILPYFENFEVFFQVLEILPVLQYRQHSPSPLGTTLNWKINEMLRDGENKQKLPETLGKSNLLRRGWRSWKVLIILSFVMSFNRALWTFINARWFNLSAVIVVLSSLSSLFNREKLRSESFEVMG